MFVKDEFGGFRIRARENLCLLYFIVPQQPSRVKPDSRENGALSLKKADQARIPPFAERIVCENIDKTGKN